jgi:hypothetical protein
MTIADEIQRFLSTGQTDDIAAAWPGSVVEAGRRAHADLMDALVSEVRARSAGARLPDVLCGPALVEFTRARLAPMVRGLFPRSEQAQVLELLQSSIVFLTPRNIVDVLRGELWLKSAWDIANLYLGSIRVELLGGGAPDIVGLSEETRCYVSARYFEDTDRFADYVVHEAAHIFHNCKRTSVGLAETRFREWLLPIDYVKRETFAYACEAYSRMCEIDPRPARRLILVDELASGPMPADERVDREEFLDILRAAAARRNGWKVILERCAPPPRKSMAQAARERHDAWVQASLARMRTDSKS